MSEVFHCKLIIEGDKAQRTGATKWLVRKRVDTGEFVLDFNRIVKEPPGLSDEEAMEWRLEHWGVANLARVVSVGSHNEKYNIKFETDGGAPLPAMFSLVHILNKQRFTFFYERERNRAGLYGTFRALKGRIVKTGGTI